MRAALDSPVPLHVKIRELREERGLSQPQLFRLTEGVGYETIRAIERDPESKYSRYPSAEVIAALANALDVEPEIFPEYRLAQARRLFDERQVGLEQAVAHLRELEQLLEEGAIKPLESAVEQASTAESRKKSGRPRGRRPAQRQPRA